FTIKLYTTGSRLITVQFILNKHPHFSRGLCLSNLYLAWFRGDGRPLKPRPSTTAFSQESAKKAQIFESDRPNSYFYSATSDSRINPSSPN
ncbi:MAG: hypothetical protein RM021_025860, partial [Nostoc sp. EkiNYC01]|nr:hypothetical protein [Nostoc sp. EkiNYC01]